MIKLKDTEVFHLIRIQIYKTPQILLGRYVIIKSKDCLKFTIKRSGLVVNSIVFEPKVGTCVSNLNPLTFYLFD